MSYMRVIFATKLLIFLYSGAVMTDFNMILCPFSWNRLKMGQQFKYKNRKRCHCLPS